MFVNSKSVEHFGSIGLLIVLRFSCVLKISFRVLFVVYGCLISGYTLFMCSQRQVLGSIFVVQGCLISGYTFFVFTQSHFLGSIFVV